MSQYINSYPNKAAYNAATDRPTDGSVVSKVDEEIIIKGVNVIAPFECARRGDHVFFDKIDGKKFVIRRGTLKPALLDSDRYVNLRNVCCGRILGHVVFVQYDRLPAEMYATGDEWTVGEFNMSAAGSATLVIKTYGADAGHTYTVPLSWNAGASIDTLVDAIKAVSGLTTYATVSRVSATTIGIVVNGYSTNMGVEVTAGSVTATRTHHGYQTRFYDGADLPHGTQILRHNGTTSYFAYACFEKFYDYYKTSGSEAHSTIGGDTIRQSAFTYGANPELYTQFNGDYDAYMHAQFDALRTEFPTTRGDLVALAFGDVNNVLADVKHTRFDGVEVYDFPNIHSASLAGVEVEGFETGFEPGTGHLGGLAEAQLLFSEIKKDKTDDVNVAITEGGGTTVDYNTTIRLAFQSNSNGAWVFNGGYGYLGGNNGRFYAHCARVFRAFSV